MARPLTRAQRLQNRAFLKALRRTGNVRLAAREVGAKYGTMQHRRAKHPAFALAWDAALAFAQARFNAAGRQGPSARKRKNPSTIHSAVNGPPPHACGVGRSGLGGSPLRTEGGEPVIVRRNDGKLQMRFAQPGKLTREGEQAFLAALSVTANVTLAAAAVGASPHAFYRRRKQNPAFAREMRLALQRGYDNLELALIEAGLAEAHDYMVGLAVSYLPPCHPITFLDPACGTGVYLRAALVALQRLHPTGEPLSLARQSLFGIDIDPWAVDAAVGARLGARRRLLGFRNPSPLKAPCREPCFS